MDEYYNLNKVKIAKRRAKDYQQKLIQIEEINKQIRIANENKTL